MTQADMEKAIAEVWALFRATQAEISTTQSEISALGKQTQSEISALGKQTQSEISALGKQTHELGKQTHELGRETDRKLNRLADTVNKLTDKWGRFVESYLAPGIPAAFQEREIPIHGTSQRVIRYSDNERMEIDIMGENTDCVIAVEVKSTLGVDDVRDFLETLSKFRRFFPEHNDKIVYGAVAGIEITGDADKFAFRKGLFVLTQAGDTISIQNSQQFKPKKW